MRRLLLALLAALACACAHARDVRGIALAELPALRPPDGTAGEIHIRSRGWTANSCPVMEAVGLGG